MDAKRLARAEEKARLDVGSILAQVWVTPKGAPEKLTRGELWEVMERRFLAALDRYGELREAKGWEAAFRDVLTDDDGAAVWLEAAVKAVEEA